MKFLLIVLCLLLFSQTSYAKPKRCQTCCPHLPSPTYLHNSIFDKYKITLPIDGEIRELNLTVTENKIGNQIIKYDLEDVKSQKKVVGMEGLLYYGTLHLTLFTIITDKYGDLVRSLDCVVNAEPNEDLQVKGDCVFVGANKFNVPTYENIPIVMRKGD